MNWVVVQRGARMVLAAGGLAWLAGCAVPPATLTTEAQSNAGAIASPALTVAALHGAEWVAVAIDGVERVASPAPRLRFAGEDYVGGNAGCNQFVGKFRFTPATAALTLGPLASTRMACMPEPHGQEDKFFKATELTRSVRLQEGALLLLDAQQQVLMRLTR